MWLLVVGCSFSALVGLTAKPSGVLSAALTDENPLLDESH